MGTELLTAEIKTRVPEGVKSAFEQIAAGRHLDVSDIVREAYREYLDRAGVDWQNGSKPEKEAA